MTQETENNSCDHLIVIAGCSVLAQAPGPNYIDEAAWHLKDREKGHFVPTDVVRHIKLGLVLHDGDPKSLLVFSGGATRNSREFKHSIETEANSYLQVAKLLRPSGSFQRVLLEPHSYNSGHNVVFGLNRFCREVHRLPTRLTIVSRDFKEERFSLYVSAVEDHLLAQSIGRRFDYTYAGVRDQDRAYSESCRNYEYSEQLPALRANRMRDFEELKRTRTPGPQGILQEAICPDLAGLVHMCARTAKEAEQGAQADTDKPGN